MGTYNDATGTHGFLDTGGTFSTIDVPFAGVLMTQAFGINSSGQIVGIYQDAAGSHGFVATPVPEPDSLILLVSGLLGLALMKHSKLLE